MSVVAADGFVASGAACGIKPSGDTDLALVATADGVEHDTGAVAAHTAGEYLEVLCDLAVGEGEARVLTNDLTYGYIDENRGTS